MGFKQTGIIDVINDGIIDKILKRKTISKDKDEFLEKIRIKFKSEGSYLQEFMCILRSIGNTYWLDLELIKGVEKLNC